jgi:hypothetical protein
MAEGKTKTNGADEGKPPQTAPFDDAEFFASEGITDDDEKDAIRSRARVQRYVNWRTTKENAPPEKKRKKPWYRED